MHHVVPSAQSLTDDGAMVAFLVYEPELGKAQSAALFVSVNYPGQSLSWPHDDPKYELTLIPHTCLARLGLKGAMFYCCGI